MPLTDQEKRNLRFSGPGSQDLAEDVLNGYNIPVVDGGGYFAATARALTVEDVLFDIGKRLAAHSI